MDIPREPGVEKWGEYNPLAERLAEEFANSNSSIQFCTFCELFDRMLEYCPDQDDPEFVTTLLHGIFSGVIKVQGELIAIQAFPSPGDRDRLKQKLSNALERNIDEEFNRFFTSAKSVQPGQIQTDQDSADF